MGRSEGKNGSFIAMSMIRMRIQLNFSSSMTPLLAKKTGGYAQISDCYVHMWLLVYLLLFKCIAGHSLGALMYLKTKTQQRHHLSSFLQLLQKVQVSSG